jgi:hypothetical protein
VRSACPESFPAGYVVVNVLGGEWGEVRAAAFPGPHAPTHQGGTWKIRPTAARVRTRVRYGLDGRYKMPPDAYHWGMYP